MPRPPQPIVDGQRKCTRCQLWKPLEEFTPRSDRPGKRLSGCKACYAAYVKLHRMKNPGTNVAQAKAWRKRHPELAKTNRRRGWERHKDREMEYTRQWHRKNRVRSRAINARKKAKRRGCEGTFTAREWEAIKAAQDYTCLRCGRREPDISLTIDHIVPVSRRGRNDKANIQGLCHSCNATKGAKHIDFRPCLTGCG